MLSISITIHSNAKG